MAVTERPRRTTVPVCGRAEGAWRWMTTVSMAAAWLAATLAVCEANDIERGRYIFGATGGCGCHTVTGQPVNSGGRRYDGPFGTVYASNITPDPRTGIGGWTDEQIITATRLGLRPNGQRLIPVHPYTAFSGMAGEDLRALTAFLRTVPPVNRPTPRKRITVPFFESVFLPAWLAAFAPRETPPRTAPTTGLARGEYLVQAVGHCGECHTPRTLTMATDQNGRSRRVSLWRTPLERTGSPSSSSATSECATCPTSTSRKTT